MSSRPQSCVADGAPNCHPCEYQRPAQDRSRERARIRRGRQRESETQADEENIVDARPWHPKYAPPGDMVLKTIAVAPDFTNPRMTAQRSAFTMSGDSFEPLDKEFPKLVQDGRLRKFVLAPKVKKEAEVFLRAAGLDAYSFYPDLHGLALRHKDQGRRRLELIRNATRRKTNRSSTDL